MYEPPSVDVCHCHVDVPEDPHVPLAADNVVPMMGNPEITGANVFTGATTPGVVPDPAMVDPPVSAST